MKNLIAIILLAIMLAGCKGGIVVETDHNASSHGSGEH